MKRILILLAMLSANCLAGLAQSNSQTGPIVLRGTILTPAGIIKHGYVAIENGRIASVSQHQPNLPGAIHLNTHGIILPGFVDVHNHLRFNVLPRWTPSQLYTNRYQWRQDPDHISLVSGPISRLETTHFCDMNKWGELRALVGGTTSVMTTKAEPCIHGLVRNLDFNSGFYGTTALNLEHIYNAPDLPLVTDPVGRAFFVGAAKFLIMDPFFESLFMHLAEGTDALSLEEFTFVKLQSLLNPKGAVIHGIPLGLADFQAMADNGTALVWSPKSNLELYGQTADLDAALDKGVEIALAPDWAVTGSSNMLDELKVADEWNKTELGGRLTDRQLVEMTTSVPAHIAGVDDHVGAITAGLRADLLVVKGDHNQPYRAVIDANAADVELVLINGVPLYGNRNMMQHFWDQADLENIDVPGATKTLATPAANLVVADVAANLQQALEAEGTSLAPLAETDNSSATARLVKTRAEGKNHAGALTITASPNPSGNIFTITTQSNSDGKLQLRVTDVLGRLVESGNGIAANSTITIGNDFRPGIYFVEVIQGSLRQRLKVIRQ